jgi:hypothetical protein
MNGFLGAVVGVGFFVVCGSVRKRRQTTYGGESMEKGRSKSKEQYLTTSHLSMIDSSV